VLQVGAITRHSPRCSQQVFWQAFTARFSGVRGGVLSSHPLLRASACILTELSIARSTAVKKHFTMETEKIDKKYLGTRTFLGTYF
jgi:hypothetical protein